MKKSKTISSGNLKTHLQSIFTTDLRGLALFRIALGLLLFKDLLGRFLEFSAYYTDAGVLPRSILFDVLGNPWHFSLFYVSGTPLVTSVLFLIGIFLALALCVGYQTRWACLGSWILLLSVHLRNPLVVDTGDQLLRMVLFWSLFLPIHARGSVDAMLSSSTQKKQQNTYTSLFFLGFLAQICCMYWFSGIFHLSNAAWKEGTALFYLLNETNGVTVWAQYLAPYAMILKKATYAILLLLLVGPLLLFLPSKNKLPQKCFVFLFTCFHLLGALFLKLYLTPWICIVVLLPFLPSSFWDRFEKSSGVQNLLTWIQPRGMRSLFTWIKKKEKLHSPFNAFFVTSSLSKGALVFSVFLLFYSCIASWLPYQGVSMPPFLKPVMRVLHFDQAWAEWTAPRKYTSWVTAAGYLKSNQYVDVLGNGGSISWEKPANLASHNPGKLFTNYITRIQHPQLAKLRPYYSWYLCRDWNLFHKNNEEAWGILLYLGYHLTGEPPSSREFQLLDSLQCFRQ